MFWLKIDVVVKPNTAGRVSESRSKQKQSCRCARPQKNYIFVVTINSWKLTQETLNTTQLFHEVNSTHEEEFTD